MTATREELLDVLRSILVAEFEVDPAAVSAEARLVEDLDLDSIDGVTIVVRLESRFSVSMTDDEMQDMATVGDIVDALFTRLGPPPCP